MYLKNEINSMHIIKRRLIFPFFEILGQTRKSLKGCWIDV
jgi:hypothetical protein